MAPEKKDKKRKATSASAASVAADLPNKKSKKSGAIDAKPVPATVTATATKSILKTKNKEKKTDESENVPAKKIKQRKRASDFLSDEEDEVDTTKVPETEPESELKPVPKKKQTVKIAEKVETKKSAPSKTKKVERTIEVSKSAEEDDEDDDEDAESEKDEIDDQTAELIRGFESSGDEDPSEDEGFEAGKAVPRIPDSKKAKRKIQKKLKESDQPDEPGTVYVGRIPHGFYEHQMRAYFSQFGDITRLRLSRNRVTGRSKHYAFIEFASAVVAKIVAETMNNYLMYGHILKCKYVPQEQQHPELWKGANRRYKRVPWNKIEKQRLERGKTRKQWTKSIEQEEKRRLAKAQKLKKLGYEFEMPQLKAIDVVPVQEENKKQLAPSGVVEETAVVAAEADNGAVAVVADTTVAVTGAAVAAVEGGEEAPKKKSKKSKKEKNVSVSDVEAATPAKKTEIQSASALESSSAKKSKAKKTKKSSSKA